MGNEMNFSTFMSDQPQAQAATPVHQNPELSLGTAADDNAVDHPVELSFSTIEGEVSTQPEPNTVILEAPTSAIRRPRQPQQHRRKVDPSQMDFLKKEQPVMKDGTDRVNHAYAAVEKAIERKTDEYAKTMAYLEERDAVNRMAVAEGIEAVEGEEVYMKPSDDDMIEDDIALDSDNAFDAALERELAEAEKNAQVASYPRNEESPSIIKAYDAPDVSFTRDIAPEVVEPQQQAPVRVEEPTIEVASKTDSEEKPSIAPEKPLTSIDDIFQTKTVSVQQDPIDMNTPLSSDVSGTSFDIDAPDIDDLDLDDEESDKDAEEERKLEDKQYDRLKSEILEKVVGTARKFDVGAMKVSKKAVSFQNALTKIKKNSNDIGKATATWALMSIKRPYVCSALTGPELTTIYDIDNTNSNFIANVQQLKILYAHDENPYKPKSFEAWAKTIPYSDLDEVFMAEYVATFGRGNYIPYACESKNCHYMELKDQKDIMEKMVRFKNDDIKKKFEEARSLPITPEMSNMYETVVVPINDTIAIGFRNPSIYTVMYEVGSLNREFLEKYMQAVNTIMYIDTIYLIDETGELYPIEYKIYPNEVSKTFKSKIATYAKILAPLKDEYSVIIAYINSMRSKESGIEYLIPEDKCSQCGAVIKEQITSAKQLVFTRPHLVNIATISQE